MLIACDLFFGGERLSGSRLKRWYPHAGYLAILLFYLCIRYIAFGSALRPDESIGYVPLSDFITMQPGFLLQLFPPIDLLIEGASGEWLFVTGLALLALGFLILFLKAKESAHRNLDKSVRLGRKGRIRD